MQKLSVALVQMESAVGDIEKNLLKIKKHVDQAAKEKVDIICFPELSVTGYSPEKSPRYAEDIPGPSSSILSRWAQELQTIILVGICEQSENEKPFITQTVCIPNGDIQKYRKTHLAPHEVSFFSTGQDFPVFQTPKVKFGIEICWELHFPEITSIFSLQGAEIVFCPYASARTPKDRQQTWHTFLPARAYDNRVFIVSCNALGEGFGGGILVCDPEGQIIIEDFQGEESIAILRINPETINSIRNQDSLSLFQSYYPKYRKDDLYRKYLLNNKKI